MVPVPHASVERPRIRRLPPDLANRIAAGEVVERPAAVVKELCENSIDARARIIEVDIEGGGVRLVRVRDDGIGMTPEEAPLALERHATSKIRTPDDLLAIATLGFRGEALPSIAAVSRFTLQTRARDDDAGTRVEVQGGAPSEVRSAGCPAGTLVEVRDLFYNTPARRKFLKTEATEVAHAVEALSRLALAFPEIDLRVRVDGREALTAPPARTLEVRVGQVLGREVADHLYPCQGSESGIQVTGLIGDPSHARGRPDSMYTYVNGRFVRDRVLQHAVQAAYLPVLERGRYPWVVLFLEVPFESVDVNVHPAKFEVRFSDSRAVHRAAEHVVAQALERAPWLGKAKTYALAPSPLPEAAPSESGFAEHLGRLREATTAYAPQPVVAPAPPVAPVAMPLPLAEGSFSSLRVIGQSHRLYIVCEGPGEIVLIDQHAAHERIHFERLRAAYEVGTIPSQPLLFPRRLELGPAEREAAEAYSAELSALGFELEPFGGGTVALKSAPALLGHADAARTAQEILSELTRVGRASALVERLGGMLATVACHAAVRAGDLLSIAECEALLRELDGVDFRGNCPHGRPVVLRARLGDLERGFERR
jgi:DNA mismatch repair protein MutL